MRCMADSSRWKQRWPFLAALFAIYFATACLITWPLIIRLGDVLAGRTTDAMVHYWNGWWFQQALQNGQSPFFTDLLNYPYGVSLVTHNFALLNIMPWLILEPIIGGIAAYNLILLIYLALCGWAMYLLAFELLMQREAAFVAGLIYLAWPFRLSQLDHPNLIATFWIPIFLLFLMRTLRSLRWLDALWAGLALALVGYTRWQLLIPAAFMTVIYLIGTTKMWLGHWRASAARLALMAVVALLALLPPAVMLAREQLSSDLAADVIFGQDERSMSTDLLAYLTPSKRHVTLKEFTKPLVDRYYPDRTSGRRYPTYIGLSVLLLGVMGLIKRWRDTWVWLLMAVMLIGLAAGMVWRINGQVLQGVPTLYRLLEPLEVARLMRIPERYAIFLALPTAVLAAYGWGTLLSYQALRRWRWPLTLGLSALILFEYQSAPLQSQYIAYDKTVFEQLAEEPGDFALLNIPLRYRFSKEYLFEQTYHGRPILQGHVSRKPENLYQFIEESAWLEGMPDLLVDPGYLMAQLNRAGIGYVVLSQYLLEDATWRLWRRHVPYEPYFKDERYLVYATTPEYGRDLAQPQEVLAGLGVADMSHAVYCGSDGLKVVTAVTWATTAALPADYGVQLTASAEQGDGSHDSMVTPLLDGWPSSEWPGGTVTRQAYAIDLPAAAGPRQLGLQIVDLATGMPLAEALPAAEIDASTCSLDGKMAAPADVTFGDRLTLLSYNVAQEEEAVVVGLNWLALQRPAKAYKVFAHLYDAQSNEIVAQIDTMPLDWRFPTTDWRAGELVADEIRLALEGVAPGEYVLALGVYEQGTGERLKVNEGSHDVTVSDDDRLILDGALLIP